jgi:hypothetical protein
MFEMEWSCSNILWFIKFFKSIKHIITSIVLLWEIPSHRRVDEGKIISREMYLEIFVIKKFFLSFNLLFKFFFCREIETIFGCKELLTIIEDTIFDDGLIAISTENQSYRRIVFCWLNHLIKHTHIHIYLTDILVSELISFEIDDQKTLEMIIVKYKSIKKSLVSVWICFWRA